MKRATLLLLTATGCLEPGAALYERADVTPPTVLFELMKPRMLPTAEVGTVLVQAGQTIELPFSEAMDPKSLRPGIVVRGNLLGERNEVPLLIQAPPPGTNPFTVRIASAEQSFLSGTYRLELRTLLIDVAGNPLGEELYGFFRVP